MYMKMQYIPPLSDIDVTAPLIYMWEIRNSEDQIVGRYVGKANGGEKRPTQHYSRNVNKLLRGFPYKKGKSYRRVHVALAEAVKAGHQISLSYLCNVSNDQNIFEVEMRYIREYGCNKADGIGLNGPSKLIRAELPIFVSDAEPVQSHYSGMQESDSTDQLDLEDFLEYIEDKYPNQFEVKSGAGRYSFWLGKERIFRAAQSGPRGKVKVKLGQTSLRGGNPKVFDWDGTADQMKVEIENELASYKNSVTGSLI
jgi:hypothetical protein